MNTNDRRQLIESLANKEYRDCYSVAHTRELIATQIREMRERRSWTQSELGARTSKKQETISQLEDADYGGYSLRTLQRLASAFDVALVVRFESFSRLVDYIACLDQRDLAVPSFEDEHLMEDVEQWTGVSTAVDIASGVGVFTEGGTFAAQGTAVCTTYETAIPVRREPLDLESYRTSRSRTSGFHIEYEQAATV